MPRYCCGCDTELVLGENWTPGQQKARCYICRGCQKLKNRRHYEANRKRIAAQSKQWAKANPERIRASRKRWRVANPEKIAVIQKRYYEAHKKEIAANNKAWREANADERRAYMRDWYRANPEKAQAMWHRAKGKRRARLAGVVTGPVDREKIFQADAYRCVYCGSKENLSLDHIVPLARGGAHTEENLVTACQHCNYSKGVKPFMLWLAQGWPSSIRRGLDACR